MPPDFAQRTAEMRPFLAMEGMERAKGGAAPGLDFGAARAGRLRFAYANSEAAVAVAPERLAAALPKPR